MSESQPSTSTAPTQSEGDQGSQQPEETPAPTPRVPRRTAMACQFCRGRKLKCDGAKPSCANCNRRGFPCVYAPV
ncbi:hypothetical protein BDN72DRAFT_958255 [Pluteus cervinus]|uniref:Uncharacterized protein n=1 Tax=Pluteus cervinus TaxID=181527 RepID=A0ACD3B0X9_9AGAR|nr:hypothetical protein BDN72DRAFT_958255 [Pluteus cervinus]